MGSRKTIGAASAQSRSALPAVPNDGSGAPASAHNRNSRLVRVSRCRDLDVPIPGGVLTPRKGSQPTRRYSRIREVSQRPAKTRAAGSGRSGPVGRGIDARRAPTRHRSIHLHGSSWQKHQRHDAEPLSTRSRARRPRSKRGALARQLAVQLAEKPARFVDIRGGR